MPVGQPLCGRQVIVTRRRENATELVQQLQSLGAAVTVVPCIGTRAMPVDAKLRQGLAQLVHASHIAFASQQGVASLVVALDASQWRIAPAAHVVAVGPTTAAAAEHFFKRRITVVSPHTAEGLAAYLVAHTDAATSHVVLPGARDGRRLVADTLRAAGVQVTCLHLYQTTAPSPGATLVTLPAGVDYVLFTSPSTVRGWVCQAVLPVGARTVSLGPTTSQALREHGLPVHGQARVHTLQGLIAALLEMEN